MAEHPAALEVFLNRVASAADGMGATLRRSAFSPNIKERLDFSCAVFDAHGRLLAQAAHIPVHLGAMPASVAAARRAVGKWRPGDVVLLNDPSHGGSHLPDLTTISPVFLPSSAEPVFFAATRAHHADVGGQAPGSLPLARDIFGEGLVIPPIHLQRGGRVVKDLLALICANSRSPGERSGDLDAQLAAHHHGAQRLADIAERTPELDKRCDALIEYARRAARSQLRRYPDGVFRAEDWMDGDGLTEREYPIRVEISFQDGRMSVDFAGTGSAAPSGINAPAAVTHSAVFYALACSIGDIPMNAGSMANVEVTIPSGSLLDPPPGAAVAAGNVETSQRVVDTVFRALALAAPDRIPAASQGTMNNLTVGGMDLRLRTAFTYYETLPGGAGAGPTRQGASAIQAHMTNTLSTPIEAIETAYPMRVQRWELRPGSGGLGRRRGGAGILRRIRFLTDVRVTVMSERRRFRPYGLAGGAPGCRGRNRRIDAQGKAHELPAKGSFDFDAGECVEIETPGGGGWGVADSPAVDQADP